jgi:hypothetical protein
MRGLPIVDRMNDTQAWSQGRSGLRAYDESPIALRRRFPNHGGTVTSLE